MQKSSTDIRQRIAVVSTWPSTKNAEYENIQRIVEASREIGIDCLVVDDQGYPLAEFTPKGMPLDRRIDYRTVDFAIYLHYTSPKLVDCFSYFALWNPADFFLRNGYASGMDNLVSHDDYLHIDSANIGRHLMRALTRYGRTHEPKFCFHTTVDGPVLPPRVGPCQLFYAGINWERITGKPGRYDRLLQRLESTGLLAIFGPRVFAGVKVWDGFASYRGEIPFDAVSTIYAINACGISLVLSSLQHQLCAAQSNRFFESLAAGALIITHASDDIRSIFGDSLLYIDSVDQDAMFDRVIEYSRWASDNPEVAAEKAAAAQKIFLDRFRLRSEIATIAAGHDDRRHELRSISKPSLPAFEVVVNAFGYEAERLVPCLDDASEQNGVEVRLSIICRADQETELRRLVEQHAAALAGNARYFPMSRPEVETALRRQTTGGSVIDALTTSTADYFIFSSPKGHWFHAHLADLSHALARTGAPVAVTGVIEESLTLSKDLTSRRIVSVQTPDVIQLACMHAPAYGAAAFPRSLVEKRDELILPDLDFYEDLYFFAKALRNSEPVLTGKPTLVRRTWVSPRPMACSVAPRLQALYMQDYLLDHTVPRDSLCRSVVDALALSQSPLPDDHVKPPTYVPPASTLGARHGMGHGGTGREHLATSWYDAEKDFSWLLGRSGGLVIPVAETEENVTCLIRLASVTLEAGQQQVVTLLANGVTLGHWTLPSSEVYVARAIVPRHLLETEGRLRLDFQPAIFKNYPGDPRLLSIRIFDVALRSASRSDVAGDMTLLREAEFASDP